MTFVVQIKLAPYIRTTYARTGKLDRMRKAQWMKKVTKAKKAATNCCNIRSG